MITHPVFSQISSDHTLSTTVNQNNNEFQITGGSVVGDNLFHSFTDFSVPSKMTALFDHPANIQNIISRVTGINISCIDGVIATNPNGIANLFLLNPNGIIFGKDARLNINGSFIATTAESIRFQDGSEFSATNPSSSSLLTVSVPVGLQFGNNPRAIVNRSNQFSQFQPLGLRVNPHQTLALIGGDIIMDRGLVNVVEGRIELGSVGPNSLVTLRPISQGWEFGYENVTNFQDISLSQSLVDGVGNDATILLYGRNITLQQDSQVVIAVLNDESTGDLTVNASESVKLIGSSLVNTGMAVFALPGSTGQGGNLIINTKKLTVQNGGGVSTINFGKGEVGKIVINASDSVDIIGTSTFSPSFFSSSAVDDGNGGEVIVNTSRFRVLDGGLILADTTGQGKGGNIIINASDYVEIRGIRLVESDNVEYPSLLSTGSGNEEFNLFGKGIAGNIHINTRQLIVADSGTIRVGTFRGGTAGNLTINSQSVFLNNGQLLANSTSGSGGNIVINASDLLVLRNNSLISAEAGTEGNIVINNSDLSVLGNNSLISPEATIESTPGNGGNIDINAMFIMAVPTENSNINANAFTGSGGNVNIAAKGIFGIEFRSQPTPLSDITVSSEFGQSGVVTFNGVTLDPQNSLVSLPSEVVDAENLVIQACGAGGVFANSEFINIGRGGLPADPYENLELNSGLADLGSPSSPSNSSPASFSNSLHSRVMPPLLEAQGWVINDQGNMVLTTQSSQVTPNASGLTPPNCDQFFSAK